MNEQTQIIKELLLNNEKLTATLALYEHYHLTKDEKKEAAEAINMAQDSDGIKRATENLNKKFNSAYQFSDEDSKWSPGFIRELLRYYENQTGYNPVVRLKAPFSVVKAFFELKANEEELDGQDKAQLGEISEALPDAMSIIADVYRDLEGTGVIQDEE